MTVFADIRKVMLNNFGETYARGRIHQADQKLSTMVQNGLLILKGTDYVIDVNLQQGQLTINDKPFNPAMMQY